MLQVKVFGPNPPCATCKRAEAQARKAAAQFPDQVEVLKLDAMGPEAEAYGMMMTPLVVIDDEVIGTGKVVPEKKLIEIIKIKLADRKKIGMNGKNLTFTAESSPILLFRAMNNPATASQGKIFRAKTI